METKLNILQRINRVMQHVTYVQKDASVGNYRAVSHDQVVSVARQHLVEHGIVIYPFQRSGNVIENRGKQIFYEGVYEITFVNMDDPNDYVSVDIHAHALDNGDKAPGKAVTYATKAAILKVLCLETGENDESRAEMREQAQPISAEQAELIETLLRETESDVPKFLSVVSRATKTDVPSVDDMPQSAYEFAVGALRKKAAQ